MLQLDEIVEGCKKYDKTYQHLLYNLFAVQARSLCYRYLINSHDLDDVVHDGFIKVFLKINQYSGKGSFEGWIKRIFINTAFEHNKKSKKKRNLFSIDALRKSTDEYDDYSDVENIDFSEEQDNNTDIKLADFSEGQIMDIVNSIPEKLKIVFCLYCIEDFSHEEIAEILNIDVVTSRTRLMRARSSIKKNLIEQCFEKNNSKS
jgi:RNA polymerase sigma-70 factor (ECF subfamily)